MFLPLAQGAADDYNAAQRPKIMEAINFSHHFLIAMPGMVDPNFAKSLTYICEHNPQGALGVVVNRPIEMTLQSLLDQISIPLQDRRRAKLPIYYGGPVQVDRGFVLHRPAGGWQSTLTVRDDVALTTSRDILQAVGEGKGPADLLVSLGYAGWAPGQLENEIIQNAWLTVPADLGVMFDLLAEQRFIAAMDLLGIDPSQLSDVAGHA